MSAESKIATFGCGCFWDVQYVFDRVSNIMKTTAGYMGGHTSSPTVKQVREGNTGHIEVVQLEYDSHKRSYEDLLEVFWQLARRLTVKALTYPTGQYQPIIFAHDVEQYTAASESLTRIKRERENLILGVYTNVLHADRFWPEPDDSHQHYFDKNPDIKYLEVMR